MAVRRIIVIDEEACDGCGLCATACHEGAIAIVDGKARLIRDEYCDGFGDCLPACPRGAISFEEREAAPYDEASVLRHLAEREAAGGGLLPPHLQGMHARGVHGQGAHEHGPHAHGPNVHDMHAHERHAHCMHAGPAGGCPGSRALSFDRKERPARIESPAMFHDDGGMDSELSQWPVQIKLVPVRAPFFDQAHLLVAADCSAYACGDFHRRFMRGRITLIGCPKLDMENYGEKLAAILQQNDIRSVTVVRMEVPCCGGIEEAVKDALRTCGKMIPWQVAVLSRDGSVCT